MGVRARSYKMNIFCINHPHYRAIRRSKCQSCQLIFILKHQHTKVAGDVLGGLNPYQFLNLEEACEGIAVMPELSPSALEFTRKGESDGNLATRLASATVRT